jgi:ubiquinone biosynthesis protein COQ9
MLEESTRFANNTEIESINAAADLLRRMLLELQGLEVNNARLHFAMSNTGHAIRRRLDMLTGITELLKPAQAPQRARELIQRAKALIRQLADELDQLALEAAHDFEGIT